MIRLLPCLTMVLLVCFILNSCGPSHTPPAGLAELGKGELLIQEDEGSENLSIYKKGSNEPILVENAAEGHRPYIHPIVAPDGKGILTQFSPDHHKHQTGLYWGFTRVNGRDFFHNPGEGYWKKISARVVEAKGKEVKWQTVYDLLDEKGAAMLTETQNWAMSEDSAGNYLMTLEWTGQAKTDITIGKYDYGGLFLRMPWEEGMKGEVVNAARQRNQKAEGQRAMWVDLGIQVEGRDDLAHIAIFDHPDNKGYPLPWRVDDQMGVGTARAKEADWKIAKGEFETIRHRLYIYSGKLNDVAMTEKWAEYSGTTATYALWDIAQQQGLDAKFLSPDEAVKAMTIKPGFKVNAFASEPMMTQPMAFCWDNKGRMWLAENKDYESRGHGFSNAGDSRILILEDTNHDGVADTKKVFLEGIAFPSAIAVGMDGAWIGAPPNLLFVPDRNHDDKGEMNDIEVRLTGWGIRDRHETLNSLHWGPDGWLYGCQGYATPSKVRKPNGKGRLYKYKDKFPENILEGDGTDINGGVWRYHPTKNRFEVVAHGFSNPWGIDYDAKGQLFISACVIPHMWHVIPGGIYHRQGGQHFNPYVYDDIKTIADHSHRSAHGGARIYQSDAFPATEKGRIFMANIHEHAVLSDILTPKGSGFVASHGDDFMSANNGQWVGFSMEVGPEGGLYVLDWHDADICGQEVKNSETGRVFRIVPEKTLAQNWPGRYGDLEKLNDHELVKLQTSPSDWHARRSRVILQGRAASGKLDKSINTDLLSLFQTASNPDWRLHALWTLHVTNLTTPDMLIKALDDKDPYVRAWAIQLLCEDRKSPAAANEKFVSMAQQDNSAVVRLYLASALQRVDEATAWQISANLSQHAEDNADHNLPKLIWYGLEGLVAKDPARAMQIASSSKLTLLTSFISRRAVDAGKLEPLVKSIGARPSNIELQMEGMISGMEGRTDLKAPPSWTTVYNSLSKGSDKTAQYANDIAALFGDTESAQRSLAVLKNSGASADQRKKALSALSAQQRKELIKVLPGLLQDKNLRLDVIRAVASFSDRGLGEQLMKFFPNASVVEKEAIIQTMSSRPVYGWIIMDMLKEKQLEKKEIPASTARQLRRVVGSGFVEVWGPIEETPKNEKEFAKYKNLFTETAMKSADRKNGEQLFIKTCGTCHKMYGTGGSIGPDLTGSNRTSVDYLLQNILNPSDEIQDTYKLVVVTTRDGRTYSGNVIGENERQITMRIVGQDAVNITKSSIQSREVMPVSMMPQGQLNNLSEKETVDLLTYLQTTKK